MDLNLKKAKKSIEINHKNRFKKIQETVNKLILKVKQFKKILEKMFTNQ